MAGKIGSISGARWIALGLCFGICAGARPDTVLAEDRTGGDTKRAESPEQWFRDGKAAVERAKRHVPITGRAKNVILFIGDGMGVSTVTAARILEGQRRGDTGEENLLSFEKLPYTALIKTYNTDQQTGDSAGTITAIVTGVKSKAWMLSVNQNTRFDDHVSAAKNMLTTIVELAERAGMSSGVVSTTRVTHATPAACYAHAPNRDWENDSDLPSEARAAGFPDIARQLVEFSAGDGLDIVLGGGRRNFLQNSAADPEYPSIAGLRSDGADLISKWLAKSGSAYVWNKEQFDKIDVAKVNRVLGLFEPSHMHYEHDRGSDGAGEPSLAEMTSRAIDLLSRNEKGYFLMVEGGRIDHAHQRANAYRALTDTIEFAEAVRAALEKVDRRDTLVIVTADHSHTFTIAGYSGRGNPILGVARNVNERTTENPLGYNRDANGLPYTTLGYANGPHHVTGERRPDLTNVATDDPDYCQEAAVPMRSETHGGEDTPLYADGPQAHLFRGVLEQNVIFHVMVEALGLGQPGER